MSKTGTYIVYNYYKLYLNYKDYFTKFMKVESQFSLGIKFTQYINIICFNSYSVRIAFNGDCCLLQQKKGENKLN